MRRNVAVILAGGTGTRAGTDVPKQFLKVAGKAVIEHTVDVFQRHAQIDEIAIVANPMYHGLVAEMVVRNNWTKAKRVLAGGSERYLSSLSAIRAYSGSEPTNLIFHDAVRPLVSSSIISEVVAALKTYKAVDTAIPAVDTIINVDPHTNLITQVPDRRRLRRGQTPQGFHLETIQAAYDKALRDPNFVTTDDCGVVVKYLPDTPVYVVAGDETNMKLTYVEDIYLIEKLFQLRSQAIGDGPAISEIAGSVVVVFGGSSGIGKEIVNLCQREKARAYGFSRTAGKIDVRDRASVERALRTVAEEEGRIDYVVNTAGVLYRQPLHLTDAETIREIVDTNLHGVINVSLASFPYLKKSRGQLLHFASSSYTRGRPQYSLYSATKAATVNFVQAIAEEWAPLGIRVNCISPERTRTPMRLRNFGLEPESTLLAPEYVAEVAVRTLLSDYSGQVIDVRNDAVDERTLEKLASSTL